MGLEGEWECPKCETHNYKTFTCRNCGYKISPDSPLIKGNPIPENDRRNYKMEVSRYAENGLQEAENVEGHLGPNIEKQMARDLIEQSAYDEQRTYNISDSVRDQVMVEVYNEMFGKNYVYSQIWGGSSSKPVIYYRYFIEGKTQDGMVISEDLRATTETNAINNFKQRYPGIKIRIVKSNEPKTEVRVHNLRELVEASRNNHGDYIVDFGKHRGKRVSEVPSHYIEWAIKETTPPVYVRCEHCGKEINANELPESAILDVTSVDYPGARYGADALIYKCPNCGKKTQSIMRR